MRILSDRDIRKLFIRVCIGILLLMLAVELYIRMEYGVFSVPVLLMVMLFGVLVLASGVKYFRFLDRRLENAAECVRKFLDGERDSRLDCDEDGELNRLFHEINTMASVLDAQNEREARNNEFLKRTMADISHQLKTPIAALNIYNGLIADADNPEDVRKFAESSERELDRMGSMIKKLLTLTRLDAGAVVFEKTEENVQELFEDITERFNARTIQEGKTIRLSGSGDAVLCCDRGWISEAFANIVQNALDHTSDGGTIDVSWAGSGNMLSIKIRDNGTGIAPEDLDHIFRRFYRSRNSSDRQGAGLGLPLAKTVIDAHDGTVLVDSRPGQGTLFTVNFLNPSKQ